MSSLTAADCTAEILFDPQIPTCGLFTVLERAGPVIKLELVMSQGLAIARATYQNAYQASLASRLGFVARTGTLSDPTDRSTQTEESSSTAPAFVTPTKPEESHAFQPEPSGVDDNVYPEEASNRLFCLIPYKGAASEREDKFLLHFAQFGRLNYYQIIRDRYGRPHVGYVCYFHAADASRALESCHPDYKATHAEPRKMSILDQGKSVYERQAFHPDCATFVERSIYTLHVETCSKLRAWRSQFAALLSSPTPLEVFKGPIRYRLPSTTQPRTTSAGGTKNH